MSTIIRYERTECSRCDGTGHYSFNPVDGTICFKCRGNKTTLTKQGASAQAKVAELKDQLLLVPASTIQVGDKFQPMGRRGWLTVEEVSPAGSTLNARIIDGVRYPSLGLIAKGTHYCFQPEAQVRIAPNPAQWELIVEFARTLPGVEIIEKEEVTA